MTETTRYFDGLCILAEYELPKEVALARSAFVRVVFVDGERDRAELIQRGALEEVTYYRFQTLASFSFDQHQAQYGGVPCRVRLAGPESEPRVCDEYSFGADGRLRGWTRETLTGGDDILAEDRYDADGAFIGRTRYLYDEEGELVGAQETTRDGKVIEHDLG